MTTESRIGGPCLSVASCTWDPKAVHPMSQPQSCIVVHFLAQSDHFFCLGRYIYIYNYFFPSIDNFPISWNSLIPLYNCSSYLHSILYTSSSAIQKCQCRSSYVCPFYLFSMIWLRLGSQRVWLYIFCENCSMVESLTHQPHTQSLLSSSWDTYTSL